MFDEILTMTENEMLSLYKSLSKDEKIEENNRLIEYRTLQNESGLEINDSLEDESRLELYLDLLIDKRLAINKTYDDECKLKVDEIRSMKKGYSFDIATKENKGKAWIIVSKNITPLSKALKLANEVKVYEVAVLFRGQIYWKSRQPTLNFSVIYV